MVWLTKWIREHVPDARVLLITDRKELDEQIEKVFKGVNEDVYRTKSGDDLIARLNDTTPWLICSLIHKFGGKEDGEEVGDIAGYIEEVKKALPRGFAGKGNWFVFVEECHRTQSGKLHEAMKEILPDAMFIGFTGTPLLKADKKRSIELFGGYIHTYRFDEAVKDKVILDLRYEARDIDQRITSQQKIDDWFEAKTKGLTPIAKAQLKQRWGTLKRVLSAQSRLEKIVVDKLLTGFDAPPATYLYIDKHMQDHGLFQAICRVNRLDGEDKDYGFIVDYKDLFRSLEQSVQDYTGGAFDGYAPEDIAGLL